MSLGRLGSLGRGFGRLGASAKKGVVVNPGSPYTMSAGTGSFVLTGDAMTPLVDYKLPAAVGAFTLTGQAATLTYSASAFTPASLSNLYAWYKADAGVLNGGSPATNGQTVDNWNDQSGVSGINLARNLSTGVTYVTGGLNGLPVVRSAGSGNALLATLSLGGTTLSVWMLAKATATNFGRICGYGVATDDTTATAFIAAYYASMTSVRAHNNGDKSQGTISSGAWNAFASVWDGTNNTLYINGTGQTPVASTPTFASSGQFTLFNNPNYGNAMTGDIAELIVVKGAFSGTDRSNLAAYSLAKWGI